MMKKILAVPLLSIGLSLPAMTLGSEIGPGFDLLKTMPGTTVEIPGVGAVPLAGNPALFPSGKGLMNTDTIIKRKQGIDPFEPPNGQGTVDVELVALSMKSIDSFDGTPLGLPGMVDLYVTVNKASELPILFPDLPQPCPTLLDSTGSMTIKHTNDNGGTFEFSLTVDACLIFVAAGGSISSPLAFTSHSFILPDPNDRTLNGNNNAPWSHEPPLGLSPAPDFPTGRFFPGVVTKEISPGVFIGRRVLIDEIALLMSHIVTLQATDVELTAKQKGNSNKVDLTLTTSAEPDAAKFTIYRGEKLPNGGTAMIEVCSFNANGVASSYPTCTTEYSVGNTYRVLEIEDNGRPILYDEVTP